MDRLIRSYVDAGDTLEDVGHIWGTDA